MTKNIHWSVAIHVYSLANYIAFLLVRCLYDFQVKKSTYHLFVDSLDWMLSGEKQYYSIEALKRQLNNRGSSPLWTFHAVVTSVSGPLWLGVELVEGPTSAHSFSSGDLVEVEDMRECMSQAVIEESLWCHMCLELLLESIYQTIQ